MIVRYQFDRDEVISLNYRHNLYVRARVLGRKSSQALWYLLLGLEIAAVGIVSGSIGMAALAFALYSGSALLYTRWQSVRETKKYYTEENLAHSLLPFQLELLGDRLILSNENLIHHHFWHGFDFLRETTSYFHLHFSPVTSLDVPNSAFSTAAQLEAFREKVTSHERPRA